MRWLRKFFSAALWAAIGAAIREPVAFILHSLGWGPLIVSALVALGLAIWAWLLKLPGPLIATVGIGSLAGLLIIIRLLIYGFDWWRYEFRSSSVASTKIAKERYLGDEDTELGTAIHFMAMFSAWARWFAAQHLALNEHKPISESNMMYTASSLVLDAAMNGKLSMRGRPADSMHYEAISRETWRLVAITMEPHPVSLWKAMVFPRSDVDPGRVHQILGYDSIILSSREFEQLWPRSDRRHDRARMKELKKAKRLGADPQAIEKLAKGNMAI